MLTNNARSGNNDQTFMIVPHMYTNKHETTAPTKHIKGTDVETKMTFAICLYKQMQNYHEYAIIASEIG